MRQVARKNGYTVIEIVIVLGLVSALVALAGVGIGSFSARQRVKGATRDMANLVHLARSEAIRTRDRHLVCFERQPDSTLLTEPGGTSVIGLAAKDDDDNGEPIDAEYVASVHADPSGSMSWGVTWATVPAPGDPTPDGTSPPPSPWTFTHAGVPKQCILFEGDGMPRSYKIGAFERGAPGTGTGAVYLTDGRTDYSLVITALGAISVHAWDGSAWRR